MSKFFIEDPEIVWEKVKCPVCQQPTGRNSECYANDLENPNPTLEHPKLGQIPILSQDCVFRKDNMWEAEINYPFSKPLWARLEKIKGLDKVWPTKPCGFLISVGRLFQEDEVKRSISREYKSFIKSLRVSESEMGEEKENKQYEGIKFPNGKIYKSNEQNELLTIKNLLPDTELLQGDYNG